MQLLTMNITGMTCGHCVAGVKRALSAVPGVQVDEVEIGRARVHFDEKTVSPERLTAVIEDEGYQVVSAS